MAIFDPVPALDQRRERLLYLLSKLLNEALEVGSAISNRDSALIALSYNEQQELVLLLSALLENRDLFVRLSFVDGVSGVNHLSEDQLREIYLSERKRLGKTRALASKQWADFLARLGSASGWSRWGVSTTEMTFGHFLKMEERLFAALGFPSNVVSFLLQKILETKSKVDRSLKTIAGKGLPAIEFRTRDLIVALLERLRSGSDVSDLSTTQIAGLTVTISNLTVLFTTRDWSAAGTISAMSGGVIQMSSKE